MTTGRKDDAGKEDWSLVIWPALRPLVRVLMHGAAKYSAENWRHVPNARRRYFAAAIRHLVAWNGGTATDAETGESHLAHAMACLMFLLALDEEVGQ